MTGNHNANTLLTFKVGPFHLGVPAMEVDAIISMPTFRSVPLAPPSVAGVFIHRGQIAGIISLRCKFGLPELADPTEGQLVLAFIEAGLMAFRVDEVLDMEAIPGVNGQPLSVLNPETVFERFAFKENRTFLATNFETLFALDELDPVPTEQVDGIKLSSTTVPAPKTAVPPAPCPKPEVQQVKSAPTHTPASNTRTPTCRSTGNNVTPTPVSRHPARRKVAALSGATSGSLAQVDRSRVSVQKRRQALTQLEKRRRAASGHTLPQTSGPLIHAQPIARSHSNAVLVLLVLFVMALGGMLTFFYWPLKAPPVPSAGITAALPANPVATHRDTPLPAIAPLVLARTTTEVDHKVAHTPEINQAKVAVEPVHAPATVAPTPGLTEALADDQPVWRVETADFILTVERPQPATPVLKPPALPVARLQEVVHLVVPGDTLWHIARRYLGNPFRYPELAALSRIKNPDMIYPGDIVRIQKKGHLPRQRT